MRQRVAVAACVAVLAGLVPAAFAGPIHDAVRAGDLARVKALVSENPKLVNEKDARGRTPLHFASQAGHREIVTALESAFFGRRPEVVAPLLEGGLKVETAGEAGRALLHRAAAAGFQPLVDYLLAHGVDGRAPTSLHATLLHSAAAGGLTTVAETLIASGANVNAGDDLGQTPVHLAAAAGRMAMVDLLLARGADPNAVSLDGRTLLHRAVNGPGRCRPYAPIAWPRHTGHASVADTAVGPLGSLGCLPPAASLSVGNPVSGAMMIPSVTLSMARYASLTRRPSSRASCGIWACRPRFPPLTRRGHRPSTRLRPP